MPFFSTDPVYAAFLCWEEKNKLFQSYGVKQNMKFSLETLHYAGIRSFSDILQNVLHNSGNCGKDYICCRIVINHEEITHHFVLSTESEMKTNMYRLFKKWVHPSTTKLVIHRLKPTGAQQNTLNSKQAR